jgi:aminocarboxymuconate-semialdehyde decarboxylase
MKIDIWTHFLSSAYVQHLEAGASGGRAFGSFLLANRALHDLDRRFEAMDRFGDYRQILTPVPGPAVHAGLRDDAITDLVRRNNEQMAETVSRSPDRFVGFAAATPLGDPDAAAEEAARAVRDLGALGVQLEEDVVGFPLHEERYDPLFAAMERLDAAVWLHPFRSPATPGLPKETAPFLLWQVFGWPFDTTITIFRLIFAGLYDRHPQLKLVAHHGGGLIPHFSGRIEMMQGHTGLDASSSDALERLRKKPIEYCRMLYVDTAMFGSPHGVDCVLRFFGTDHILFGTDTPFDGTGGSHFVPTTISDVESAAPDQIAQGAIFEGNARKVLKIVA